MRFIYLFIWVSACAAAVNTKTDRKTREGSWQHPTGSCQMLEQENARGSYHEHNISNLFSRSLGS